MLLRILKYRRCQRLYWSKKGKNVKGLSVSRKMNFIGWLRNTGSKTEICINIYSPNEAYITQVDCSLNKVCVASTFVMSREIIFYKSLISRLKVTTRTEVTIWKREKKPIVAKIKLSKYLKEQELYASTFRSAISSGTPTLKFNLNQAKLQYKTRLIAQYNYQSWKRRLVHFATAT